MTPHGDRSGGPPAPDAWPWAVWIALVILSTAVVDARLPWTKRVDATAPGETRFPNVVFTTQQGKKVRFYDDVLKGDRIVLVNFMYTHCNGICPGTTCNLLQVQKRLADRFGKDIFLYSITLAPEEDTPAVLADYARSNRCGKGWTFLTGSRADVELVRRKLGFTDPDSTLDRDRANHSGMVLLGNESIDRWMACAALENPDRLAESVLWMESPRMRAEHRRLVLEGGSQ